MMGENGFENLVWFLGIVEDNDDPTHSGRIRVRAFGFHPPVSTNEVLTEDLPWAPVLNGAGGKFYSVPDNGSWVFGFFIDGRDAQHPMIMGVIPGAKHALPFDGAVGNPSGTTQGASPAYAPSSVDPSGPGVGSTDRANYAMNYFVDQGYTPEQAAGIVGNLQAESGSNIDPSAFNPAGGGEGARGIAQWRGPRIRDFRREVGKDPLDASFEEQLDFMMWELNNTESSANESIQGTTTATDAATTFERTYERAGGSGLQRRVNNATTLLENFTRPGTNVEGAEAYVAPTQDSYKNFGNPAMPPQMTGEDLELTPLVPASASRKNVKYSSATYNEKEYQEPGVPFSGSVKSQVWQTRYGGSYIEMSGDDEEDEFINLVHSSGAHVTLDSAGSIIIKSFGDTNSVTEGNIKEVSTGSKESVHEGGYTIHIQNGTCEIRSEGNMSLATGGDFDLSVAGRMSVNVGDAIDMAGARVALTAREDTFDIASATTTTIHALEEMHIKSEDNMFLETSAEMHQRSEGLFALNAEGNASFNTSGNMHSVASGSVNIQGGPLIAADAGDVHLNSGQSSSGDTAGNAQDATRAGVPDAPDKSVFSENKTPSSPSSISPDMIDDPIEV